MRTLGSLVTVIGLTLFASQAVAQIEGGPGSATFGPVDTELATGGLANLGVQYSPATNTIFITGRGNTLGGAYVNTPPHSIYEIDLAGNLLNTVQQTTTSPLWGHRDGATDGMLLFFGDEEGLHCFDPLTLTYQTAPAVLTNNGPQIAIFPIPAATLGVGNVRAVAYDPAGNGGDGSFWSADFGSAIIEFDLAGTVITTWPNLSSWSLYGLAWDPVRGMLWGSTSPAFGDLVEIDPTTGLETGVRFVRHVSNGTQGGLCWMQRPGGGAGGAVPHSELLVLVQGAPDDIVGHRVDLYDPGVPARGHWDELQLQIDVNGAGAGTGNRLFTDGDTLSWQYGASAQGVPPPMTPGLLLLAIGPDAGVIASTPAIPELVITNLFSTPSTVGATFTIGDGFGVGGLAAPVLLPLGPHFATDPAVSFTWPAGGPLNPGDEIRLQALVADGGTVYGAANPINAYATNSAKFTYRTPGCDGSGFEGLSTGIGNYPPGWTNGPGGTAGDEWQPIIGSTPSGSTGASGAFLGTTYMFCETTGAQNTWPKTFVMDTSPLQDCGTPTPTLNFAYHMWGGTMGTLTVEDLDAMGNPIGVVFTISGDQGNQWNTASVPVTPTASGTVTLRFTCVTPAGNNSWQSDICIDEIWVQ